MNFQNKFSEALLNAIKNGEVTVNLEAKTAKILIDVSRESESDPEKRGYQMLPKMKKFMGFQAELKTWGYSIVSSDH